MWHPTQMEPAIGRAVIAAGIISAHDAAVANVGHFGRELERANNSCEYHVHPDKLAPIAEALEAWRKHTFAWIAENGKHKDLLFEVLRAAEPTSFLRDRPSGAQQIERAVREWGDGDQGPPSAPGI